MTPKKQAAEVRLERVAKRYGAVTAVKPLDLVIEAGSLVTLLGPSGCGKTTLLRMIAGLERVSEGKLSISGRDVTDLSAGERNVSMVFQSYALFPHMSVLENVAFGLISGGMGKPEAYAKAEDALTTVGLKGYGSRLPSEMSGASSSASRWRGHWCSNRMFCSSMSHSRTSMRASGARCARKSASCSSGLA